MWAAAGDAELVLSARQQDRAGKEAFVEIVRRHQQAVAGVAYSITGRIGLTDDIAQETFLCAWKRLGTLREPGKLKAWLAKIAHDCAVDALRREKPHQRLDAETMRVTRAPDAPPDCALAAAEEEAMVWTALGALPETVRTPLVLFYREGQSVAAVAAALDLSEDAVKQRLSRGRTALREQVAARIEGVLCRVQSGPMVIVAITSAIGLTAAPEAAASAVVSKATGAGHPHWLTAAAAVAVCAPVGWAMRPARGMPAALPASGAVAAPTDALAELADNALLREWRRLHAVHGRDAAAMTAIYDAVQDAQPDFHRHALRHALLLEWAGVDPAGGLDFLRPQKQHGHATVIAREWLRRDAPAAAEWLAAAAPDAPEIVRALLAEVAERAPEQLAAMAGALAMPEDAGKKEISSAFEIWAARNPSGARAAAETMQGKQAAAALAGVAAGWAQRNGAAAVAWAKAMEKGGTRDAVLTAAIVGWGRADPLAALGCYEDLPPDVGHNESGRADLMRAAVERDPDAALEWVRIHADKIRSSGVSDTFSSVLDERFRKDPDAFLTWLTGYSESGRKMLFQSLCRRALDTPEHGARLWTWVGALPANHAQHEMRDWMIRVAPDAEQALDWMKLLPDNWISCSLIWTQIDSRFLSRLSNRPGASRADVYERIIAEFPPALQSGLYCKALEATVEWDDAALVRWRDRVLSGHKESRGVQLSAAARSIARVNPELAIEWARALPDGWQQDASITSAVSIWAEGDPAAASTWLNALPPGREKQTATIALVNAVEAEDPERAIAWAVTLPENALGEEAWCELVESLHHKDPVKARAVADSVPMPAGARSWFLEKYGKSPATGKP